MTRGGFALTLALCLLGGAGVKAAELAADTGSAAVLFVHCVHEAGQPEELRSWLSNGGANALPDEMASKFLQGMPGRVYQSSASFIASQDNGDCSVLSRKADTAQFVGLFEAWLNLRELSFAPPHREVHSEGGVTMTSLDYDVVGEGRHWMVAISGSTGTVAFTTIATAHEVR